MIKKNKKESKQNTRNRTINLRYKSTAYNLLKVFKKKMQDLTSSGLCLNAEAQADLFALKSALSSAFDKATQKGVLHKNTSRKKKLKVQLTCKKILSLY